MLHRRRRDDDFVTLKEFMLAKFADQGLAVTAALNAAEKAVGKAEVAAEKRFDSVNEFRAALSDQATTFMPRAEYEAVHSALVDKVEDLDRRKQEDINHLLGLHTALELRVSSRLDMSSGEDKGAEVARSAATAAASARSRTLGTVIAAVGVLLAGMALAVTIIVAAIHGGG